MSAHVGQLELAGARPVPGGAVASPGVAGSSQAPGTRHAAPWGPSCSSAEGLNKWSSRVSWRGGWTRSLCAWGSGAGGIICSNQDWVLSFEASDQHPAAL